MTDLEKAREVAAELRKRAHLAKAVNNSGQAMVLLGVLSSNTSEISNATVGIIPYDMGLPRRRTMTAKQIVDEIINLETKLTVKWDHDHTE